MKKTKLLIATAALSLAAVAAGTVSTMAWYTADQQAKISKGNAVEGTLSTKASTIAASTYSINFTVKVGGAASKQLELSHVYATSDGNLNGVTSPAAGDLIYGIVSNEVATMRKVAAGNKDNFIAPVTVEAEWVTAPTDPAEIASINGKTFTATFTATAQAYLLDKNDVTGLTQSATGSVEFTIAYVSATSSWTFTAGTYTNAFVHVEPSDLSSAENGTEGSLTVTSISGVIVAA